MKFDGPAFVRQVALRLIQEFEFSAEAGTPGLVGAAKEHPARVQLQALMPHGVSIGSGIVIDSFGDASRQQDIVVYESLCPVFSRNGSPDASYYPIEGVIAAGEVKSALGKAELIDAFEKSKSVKRLQRRREATDDYGLGKGAVSYRHYGHPSGFAATEDDQFDPSKSLDQVFTFVLCQSFATSPISVLKNAISLCGSEGPGVCPNHIASLSDGFIAPVDASKASLTRSATDGDSLLLSDDVDQAFAVLISRLRLYARSGRTVDAKHFDRYFEPLTGPGPVRVTAQLPYP